ncbi:hypothetical protein KIN20_016318 [Parelaphostrongylus tenuis]|uniref:Uncharacterized protein n=1 Tax=Parelaphostrongylus tenuis TaxID=148309 RepID=A0AAD5QPN9_PARTN|nr:hypothetical protein KIN20_016318 [Parelaphostrongylus tenuis]
MAEGLKIPHHSKPPKSRAIKVKITTENACANTFSQSHYERLNSTIFKVTHEQCDNGLIGLYLYCRCELRGAEIFDGYCYMKCNHEIAGMEAKLEPCVCEVNSNYGHLGWP